MNEIIRNKVQNACVYLALKIPNLSLTKMLKLLYIIDYTSMKELGVPMLWVKYYAWKNGPVAKDVYFACVNTSSNDILNLCSAISVMTKPNNMVENFATARYIKPVKEFEDGNFSDYEIDLLDRIVEQYKNVSSKELVSILHKEGWGWRETIVEHSIEFTSNISNVEIDISKYILHDDILCMIYDNAIDSLNFK